MSSLSLRPVLHQLRRLAAPAVGELTDRQLLECFAARHEEAAFAALVRRHGPMVLGVCRRVLGQEQDAEDAFQATFLVLARKAAGLTWDESVAGWLYQVASRISLKARAQAARRRLQERQAATMPRTDAVDEAARGELQELIDQELRRLPAKYRAPVVLCYLEGKSHAEAARQLGWPPGTVKGRLARARLRLRAGLARRGLAPAVAAVVPLLTDRLAPAAVPAALGDAAVRAAVPFAAGSAAGGAASAQAVALADALLRATAAGKLRLLALLLAALAVCGVGAGLLTVDWKGGRSAAAAEPPAPAGARDEPAPADRQPPPEQPPYRALRAALVKRAGGNARSEAAVAAGLDWLARHQAADGHWSLDNFAEDAHCDCTGRGMKNNTAGTAFGLLPFLGAGITPRSTGKDAAHARNVERGLAFLVQRQKKDGEFPEGMYAHALAAMAVCQAYGLTADPALKGPAERALDYIVKGQDTKGGGWRYLPRRDSDTSVTGWHVQALKWGELAGRPIPGPTADGVTHWLDSCESPDGGYGYIMPTTATPAMTAAGLLCRQTLGWGKRKPTLLQGVTRLELTPPGSIHSLYYDYYATQVLHNLGGPRWDNWNRAMRDRLIDTQESADTANHAHEKGSWSPQGDVLGTAGGRVMITSLALLTLEVYYRTDLVLAGRPPRELKPGDLRGLWDDLAGDDVPRARAAVWALARAPGQAVPFLEEHVPPARRALNRRRLELAVAELDDDHFEVRERAADELAKAGELAEPALRKLLEGRPTPEARRRAEDLLEAVANSAYTPEWQRTRRALEALELSGTPEARHVLEGLAEGTPEARLTREAKAALERLAKQGPGKP